MLTTLVVLLAAATIAVPLTRRAGFGSVLGYLLAGIVIGPAGLRLVTDVEAIADIASLGVIMLLFLIGLEVRPQRLWVMRRSVFGLGTAQVVISGAALAALAHAAGVGWQGAVVLGVSLFSVTKAILRTRPSRNQSLQSRWAASSSSSAWRPICAAISVASAANASINEVVLPADA